MNDASRASRRPLTSEGVDRSSASAAADVPERLYRRHLCIPERALLEPQIARLADDARAWYARHGEPWTADAWHDVCDVVGDHVVLANGHELRSATLARGCREADVGVVAVLGVSAGAAVDREIERLWKEERPDAATFLSAFAAAVVEQLRSRLESTVRADARPEGLRALPRYAPGYDGWELRDQQTLRDLLPERGPVSVLPSGGLTPARSTFCVVCLGRRAPTEGGRSFWDRLIPSAPPAAAGPPSSAQEEEGTSYSFPEKVLGRWGQERLVLRRGEGGSIRARFRFDGTTCMNMGTPLRFVYTVDLERNVEGDSERFRVRRAACEPAPDDSGHRSMCLFEMDYEGYRRALEEEIPIVGRSLDDALLWRPEQSPSACLCTAASRAHKWKIVLETLHHRIMKGGTVDS